MNSYAPQDAFLHNMYYAHNWIWADPPGSPL